MFVCILFEKSMLLLFAPPFIIPELIALLVKRNVFTTFLFNSLATDDNTSKKQRKTDHRRQKFNNYLHLRIFR